VGCAWVLLSGTGHPRCGGAAAGLVRGWRKQSDGAQAAGVDGPTAHHGYDHAQPRIPGRTWSQVASKNSRPGSVVRTRPLLPDRRRGTQSSSGPVRYFSQAVDRGLDHKVRTTMTCAVRISRPSCEEIEARYGGPSRCKPGLGGARVPLFRPWCHFLCKFQIQAVALVPPLYLLYRGVGLQPGCRNRVPRPGSLAGESHLTSPLRTIPLMMTIAVRKKSEPSHVTPPDGMA
jgi:hypothetical protein